MDATAIGSMANVALGVFLVAAGFLTHHSLKIPGRTWFALFLGLVGLSYALEGVGFTRVGVSGQWTWILHLAYVVTLLDPPFLLLFALAWERRRIPAWLAAVVLAPAVLLAGYGLFTWLTREEGLAYRGAGWGNAAMLGAYYALALVFVAREHHRANSTDERVLRRSVLVVLALIVLPRLPLIASDLRQYSQLARNSTEAIAVFDGGLVVLASLAAAAFLLTAPRAARADARRTVVTAAALLGIVLAVWVLRYTPLASPTWTLFYSGRWFVFAGVFTAALQRRELLGVPSVVSRWARVGFAAVLVALIFSQLVVILLGGGAGIGTAVFSAAGLSLGLGAGLLVVGRGRRGDDGAALRRIYRAHAQLSTPPDRLAELRRSLGLTPEEAAREERLVALERAAPAEGLDRPVPGQTFAGRYRVDRVLGAGSFGLVYLGEDALDGRAVVLKELRDAWRGSPEAVERLRSEARATLNVSDPHVVALLAIERSADGDVLVLQHVEGETLRERLRRGPLAEAEARRVAKDMLAGLAALHDASILHRDVKPDNVMLTPAGDAVLIDLGSAAGAGEGGTRLAADAPHPGTPAYMSPEQRAGGRLSPASDVYAAALVMWEALAGVAHPEGTVPAPWRAALDRALALDPRARWASAREFRKVISGPDA